MLAMMASWVASLPAIDFTETNLLLLFHLSAIFFSILWITVSIYTYYPIVRYWFSGDVAEDLTKLERDVVWLADEKSVDERPRPIVSDGGHRNSPTIDVLVPAYDEADVLEDTVRSLVNADYPTDRITVAVLVEPDDETTRGVVADLQRDYAITEVVVPEDYPGEANKPRALNYGFEVTAGEIVGVIDAEDLIEPTLFRKVVGALFDRDADYAQGLLDMVNEGDGWRNLVFRGEYGFWYRLFLPASWRAGYPIPLGGSTNFFRREVLEAVSDRRIERFGHPWPVEDRVWAEDHGLHKWVPWDPANVTEDFELGMFLWREGYDLQLIQTITLEESPVDLDNWMRQRTRWHRGKLYTFRQAIRHPPRGLGRKGHVLAQAFLPHYGALTVIGIGIVLGLANLARYDPPFAIWLLLFGGLLLIPVAVAVQTAGYWIATTVGDRRVRVLRTGVSAMVLPAYWVLTWIAAFRASWQLYAGPFGWEKTDHPGNHRDAADRGQLPGYRQW